MNWSNIALLVVVVLLPGAAAGFALLPPRRTHFALKIAGVFGFGYAVNALVAGILVLAGILNPGFFFFSLAAATIALALVGQSRTGIREHLAALREQAAEPAAWVGLGVVAVAAWIHAGTQAAKNLAFASPWRYWSDGLELADAGGVPDATLQWGTTLKPTVSKILLNSFSGAMSYVFGSEALPAFDVLVWFTAVGLTAALWALGRSFGLRAAAPLLGLLTLPGTDLYRDALGVDLDAYRAENLGRMIALFALAWTIWTIREKGSIPQFVIAGTLFGVAAGTHLIPMVIAAFVAAWYGIFVLLSGGHWNRQGIVASIGGVATTFALALLLWGTFTTAAGGDIGFQGAAAGGAYASFDMDPTLYFNTGREKEIVPKEQRRWYEKPGVTARRFTSAALAEQDAVPAPVAGLIAVGVAVGIFVWGPAPLKPLGAAAVMTAFTLLAAGWFFSFRYATLVPASFGNRRLFDYAPLATLLLLLVLFEWAATPLARLRSWAPAAASGLAALLFVVLARPQVIPHRDMAISIDAFDVIRATLPCDSRILTNRRTAGSFQALTGRASVVEGMAAYLRPELLDDVIKRIVAARRFFNDPRENRDLLMREGIDHVVVTRWIFVGQGGGGIGLDQNLSLFDDLDFLEPVRVTPGVDIYRVVGNPAGDFARPPEFPGFDCRREPIEDGVTFARADGT